MQLSGHTKTDAGLRVRSKLEKRKYPTGVVTTDAEMQKLDLRKHTFHGEWNYALHPRLNWSIDESDQTILNSRLSVMLLALGCVHSGELAPVVVTGVVVETVDRGSLKHHRSPTLFLVDELVRR